MATKFGKAEVSEADKTLAKALSHPVRAAALTILNARVASPTEIATELELPLGNVSYHINELEKYGCVELVAPDQIGAPSSTSTVASPNSTYPMISSRS